MKNSPFIRTLSELCYSFFHVVVALGFVWAFVYMVQHELQSEDPVPTLKLKSFVEASPCQAQAVSERLNQAKAVLNQDLVPIQMRCVRQAELDKAEAERVASNVIALKAQRAILR